MSKARGTAVASLTALIAALMIPLAMPGTAQAGYQVSKTVGIRMLDVNVLRSDCRTYPVEWVVGNFNESWGTTGYTWDWRLTLTLANPKHPEERSATIRLAGVDAKSGRTSFRLCGTKHSAGRFVATAKVSASPRVASDCAPLDNDVVLPPLPAGVGRACSFNSGFGEDRAQISTLFKRPTRITLAIATCRYDKAVYGGTPMLGRGVVYRQAKSGAWVKAPGADVLLDTFDAFGGNEWRYSKWARTDASGAFLMSVPVSIEGLRYRVRTPATSTYLKATSTRTRSTCF